jgi:hypothetical protein
MSEAVASVADAIGLAECAQRLAIPYQDAHRLLLLGRLAGVKRGGRWFVARESLDRLLLERGCSPVAPAASGTHLPAAPKPSGRRRLG